MEQNDSAQNEQISRLSPAKKASLLKSYKTAFDVFLCEFKLWYDTEEESTKAVLGYSEVLRQFLLTQLEAQTMGVLLLFPGSREGLQRHWLMEAEKQKQFVGRCMAELREILDRMERSATRLFEFHFNQGNDLISTANQNSSNFGPVEILFKTQEILLMMEKEMYRKEEIFKKMALDSLVHQSSGLNLLDQISTIWSSLSDESFIQKEAVDNAYSHSSKRKVLKK
mmetsp:Transcript_15295/g.19593  ORF Transcript_15295/g.19593 Transcript_15295/m.19593 type:complete len:225 (+) Transcript_15295:152-826(+)